MVEVFRKYVHREALFEPADKVLLAVSGGVDSMVMSELFRQCGFTFAVAHCHFNLRGKESDGDERFVKKRAATLGVPFFARRFDTRRYAQERGISIQMAARELRYRWFEEIRESQGYHFTATAHHSDDAAETLLLNLIRGTGIAGMHGIQPVRGKIIRPLLFASKKQIERYARKNRIPWRRDSSNDDEKYLRNRIRKTVIPALKKINPSATGSLLRTAGYLHDAEMICRQYISKVKEGLVIEKDGKAQISMTALKKLHPLKTWMFELLRDYGFSAHTSCEIAASLGGQPGLQFFSPTHRLVRDRKYLFITPNEEGKNNNEETLIHPDTDRIFSPLKMHFSRKRLRRGEPLPTNPCIAWLDFQKLSFPLILRRWKPGDAFIPLGMKGTKKLSDFLTERKVPRHEKGISWVVLSNGEIIWVVGHRIDERYKVTTETEEVYVMGEARNH